jgi:endonuclease-3 related protein
MTRTAQLLDEMYEAMLAHFGHQGWWPGETPFEICVGAILTQNTNWNNVEKALANLKAAGLTSPEKLAVATIDELAALIRPAGYYNVKARRLTAWNRCVMQRYGGDLGAMLDQSKEALREELLGIKGVGRETADSMILYAAGLATFVVDAYTARILVRHGLIDPEFADYESIKALFEENLPESVELFNDYHAQLVSVGKFFCKPTARCVGCPLEPFEHDARAV